MLKYINTAILLMLAFSPAAADPIINNPAPALAGDDQGAELFLPDDVVVSIEILDIATALVGTPFPDAGFGGTEFGFYFYNDASNLITIFDALDQNPDPGGPGDVGQVALLNFLAGEVIDNDAGITQSTFTPRADTPIGFYIKLAADFVDFFGFGFDTIYSQAGRNTGDQDLMGAFPLLDNPGYLLAFAAENPFNGNTLLLDLQIAINVTAVPEPPSWVLLLGGMLLISRRRSWYSKKKLLGVA